MSDNTENKAILENEAKSKKVSKSDLRKTYLLWYFLAEVSNSFERLQSLSFCTSIMPILKKLYPNKEDLSNALTRHLQFFNTEGIFGSIIHGCTIAMEEQKANGEDIPDEVISSVKTGLMGPIAGIGDTITWGTIRPILFGLGISFAIEGSAIGAIIPFLFSIITFIIGYRLWFLGYSLGRDSVKSILQGGWIHEVMQAAGILGLFMMGALSANAVKLTTPLAFEFTTTLAVQDVIDSIAPGLLPLAAIFGVVWYFKNKGRNMMKLLILILIVSLAGSFFGIL